MSEGNESAEIITVEVTVNNQNIRFITGYGPQEHDNQRKHTFYARLNEEISSAVRRWLDLLYSLNWMLIAKLEVD